MRIKVATNLMKEDDSAGTRLMSDCLAMMCLCKTLVQERGDEKRHDSLGCVKHVHIRMLRSTFVTPTRWVTTTNKDSARRFANTAPEDMPRVGPFNDLRSQTGRVRVSRSLSWKPILDCDCSSLVQFGSVCDPYTRHLPQL